MSERVEVPEEFARLGYSGLFHAEATIDGGAEAIVAWREKVPCLLPTPGWMALSVDAEQATVTVVRQDDHAVYDLVAGPVKRRISDENRRLKGRDAP